MTNTPISQSAPPAIPGSSLVGYAWDANPDATRHVIYLGLDAHNNTHVYELWYAPSTFSWFYQDLTAAASASGAPNALPGSALAGYVRDTDNSEHVIYLGKDNNGDTHVYQLWLSQRGSWMCKDLTAATGAPNPIAGSALAGYACDLDQSEHVIYLGLDSYNNTHVYQLWLSQGGSWACKDLTAATGAPNALPGSALAGFAWDLDTTEQVLYLGLDPTNGATHVYQLYCIPGSHHWDWNDLTAEAPGAPNVTTGNALAPYSWDNDYSEHVNYLSLDPTSSDPHVYQLLWVSSPGASWTCKDLTAATGAPNPIAGSALAGYTWNNYSQQVFYLGLDPTNGDPHVYQFSSQTGAWSWKDLTAAAPGAPNAVAGNALAGYAGSDSEHAIFLGSDNHIYDLSCDHLFGAWSCLDLTAHSLSGSYGSLSHSRK